MTWSRCIQSSRLRLLAGKARETEQNIASIASTSACSLTPPTKTVLVRSSSPWTANTYSSRQHSSMRREISSVTATPDWPLKLLHCCSKMGTILEPFLKIRNSLSLARIVIQSGYFELRPQQENSLPQVINFLGLVSLNSILVFWAEYLTFFRGHLQNFRAESQRHRSESIE